MRGREGERRKEEERVISGKSGTLLTSCSLHIFFLSIISLREKEGRAVMSASSCLALDM